MEVPFTTANGKPRVYFDVNRVGGGAYTNVGTTVRYLTVRVGGPGSKEATVRFTADTVTTSPKLKDLGDVVVGLYYTGSTLADPKGNSTTSHSGGSVPSPFVPKLPLK